jgi:hypothetical protein
MMSLVITALASVIVAMSLYVSGVFAPGNYNTAVIADSPAPEASVYFNSNAASMTAAVGTSIERDNAAMIEQSLVGVCRDVYWMGIANNCSSINEAFTWQFLFVGGGGNTGSLNTVLGSASSSTFSCATPGQYGVYLLGNLYGTSGLAGYNYNLNIYKSGAIQVIGAQPDPCAYADIVYTL